MMTNMEKLDYIIDQMIVMGETGHMKTLPCLNVNHSARNPIRDESVTPGVLTDRIKQGLIDAGVKDMFDEKIVEQLMGGTAKGKEQVPEELGMSASKSKGRGI